MEHINAKLLFILFDDFDVNEFKTIHNACAIGIPLNVNQFTPLSRNFYFYDSDDNE